MKPSILTYIQIRVMIIMDNISNLRKQVDIYEIYEAFAKCMVTMVALT